MVTAKVYYRREIKDFRGADATLETLRATHATLCLASIPGGVVAAGIPALLDEIYTHFQAENWSPNGEGRALVELAGVHHTSMSVGDAIMLIQDGEVLGTFEVAECGWRNVL